jgi:hypothetical protein
VRSQRSDSSSEVPSFKLALMTHGTDVSAFEVSVGATPNPVHALRRFASISIKVYSPVI